MNVNIEPIVVERIYEAPVSAVWRPSRTVRRCAGGTSREMTDFRPEVGFETGSVSTTKAKITCTNGRLSSCSGTKDRLPMAIWGARETRQLPGNCLRRRAARG